MASNFEAVEGTQHKDCMRGILYWSSIPNPDANTSTLNVQLLVDQNKIQSNGTPYYNWNGKVRGAYIGIDGDTQHFGEFNSDTTDGKWDYSPSTSPTERWAKIIVTRNGYVIPHNPDGSKTVTLTGEFTLTSGDKGPGEITLTAYATLDPIPRTPSAPPYLTADMRRDGSILLSWGASSGYVTGYDLEYLYSDPNTNAYSSWIPLATTASTSYIDGSEKWAAGTGFTYQVRARNGTLASNWTYTGWVHRKGGLYVSSGGERKFGTVYAPGTPPLKAKGVFIGNANGTSIESIRITSERT